MDYPEVPYTRLHTRTWTEVTEYAKPEEFVFRIGGYGILFNEQGELLLIKCINRGLYDIPGGGALPTENLKETCKREFKEETGVEVEVGKLKAATETLWTLDAYPPTNAVRLYYEVKMIGGTLLKDGNGHDSFACVWVPRSEITSENTIQPVIEALHQLA